MCESEHVVFVYYSRGGRVGPQNRGPTIKIFIGNLSEKTTSEELRALFETYGDVQEADALGNFEKYYGFIVSLTKELYFLSYMNIIRCSAHYNLDYKNKSDNDVWSI